MPDSRLIIYTEDIVTTTAYGPIGCGASVVNTTETQAQVVYRDAGVFSNLSCWIDVVTGSSTTVTTRKGAASGNLTVNLTSGFATVEDTTHTDTVTAGDKWDLQTNTGGNEAINYVRAVTYAPSSGSTTVSRCIACSTATSFNTASTNYYNPLAGKLRANTTEADAQTRIMKAGTLSNLFINVVTNSGTTSGTLTSRIGVANGNLSIALSNSTGILEDTTHTDTVSSGNDVDTQFAAGATSPNVSTCVLGMSYNSTNGDSVNSDQDPSLLSVATTTSKYFGLSGNLTATASAGDTEAAITARDTFTMSNLTANITSNSITATSTVTFRVGGANGNEIVSYGSGGTGVVSDTTHTDVLTVTSAINYAINPGGSGSTLSLAYIEVWGNLAGGGGGTLHIVSISEFVMNKTVLQ